MCLLISYGADVASLQESTHTKRHAKKKKIKKKNTLFAATDKVNKLLLQRAPGAQLEAPPAQQPTPAPRRAPGLVAARHPQRLLPSPQSAAQLRTALEPFCGADEF